MQWVKVHAIKCYGHHGCLPQETAIGGWYEVDVDLATDFQEAAQKDELQGTIDYVEVNAMVEEEMARPSKLVETVIFRLRERIDAHPHWNIFGGAIRIRKIAPPIGGNVPYIEIEETW